MLVDVGGTLCSPLHAHLHQLDDVTWAVGGAREAKRRRVIKGCSDFTEYWSRISLFIICIRMYCTDLEERVVTSYSPSGPRETLCHSSPCMYKREIHTRDMQVHRLSKFDSFLYIHTYMYINIIMYVQTCSTLPKAYTYILIHHTHTYINVHLNFGAAYTQYIPYTHSATQHGHTHTCTEANTQV